MQRSYSDNMSDSSSSVTIPGNARLPSLSPYLDFDPKVLAPREPQYIYPEGSNGKRGPNDFIFMEISGSWLLGGVVGGALGLYQGLHLVDQAGLTGKLRYSQLLTSVEKKATFTGGRCGTIAVIFGISRGIISYLRDAEDEFNTLGAAALTGSLFRSPGGLRKSALGGAIGLAVATVYCLSQSDGFAQFKRQRNPY